MKTQWKVYIINTERNKLYTGITTDIERRFLEHLSGFRGAKFTRANSPTELLYCEELEDRSSASKREAQIKKMSRIEKLELIKKGRL